MLMASKTIFYFGGKTMSQATVLASKFEALLAREIGQLEHEAKCSPAEAAPGVREQLAEAKFVQSLWNEAKLATFGRVDL